MASPSVCILRRVATQRVEGVGIQQSTAARLLVVVDSTAEVVRRDVTNTLADLHRRLVVSDDKLEVERTFAVRRQKYVLGSASVVIRRV